MSNNPKNPTDILAEQATLPPPSDNVEAEMRKALLGLQLKQVSKQVHEQEEAENAQRASRMQTAMALEKARQQQEDIQKACPHLKPNGMSAIAGQRDHSHNYIFLCAYCQKLYNQHTIPSHLRIDTARVGGPD